MLQCRLIQHLLGRSLFGVIVLARGLRAEEAVLGSCYIVGMWEAESVDCAVVIFESDDCGGLLGTRDTHASKTTDNFIGVNHFACKIIDVAGNKSGGMVVNTKRF